MTEVYGERCTWSTGREAYIGYPAAIWAGPGTLRFSKEGNDTGCLSKEQNKRQNKEGSWHYGNCSSL